MGYKTSVIYLKSLEAELEKCIASGQYSPQYLEGYKGAISCLEFASREYEMPSPAKPVHRKKAASIKSVQPEERVTCPTMEELTGELIRIVRVLALLEGVPL